MPNLGKRTKQKGKRTLTKKQNNKVSGKIPKKLIIKTKNTPNIQKKNLKVNLHDIASNKKLSTVKRRKTDNSQTNIPKRTASINKQKNNRINRRAIGSLNTTEPEKKDNLEKESTNQNLLQSNANPHRSVIFAPCTIKILSKSQPIDSEYSKSATMVNSKYPIKAKQVDIENMHSFEQIEKCSNPNLYPIKFSSKSNHIGENIESDQNHSADKSILKQVGENMEPEQDRHSADKSILKQVGENMEPEQDRHSADKSILKQVGENMEPDQNIFADKSILKQTSENIELEQDHHSDDKSILKQTSENIELEKDHHSADKSILKQVGKNIGSDQNHSSEIISMRHIDGNIVSVQSLTTDTPFLKQIGKNIENEQIIESLFNKPEDFYKNDTIKESHVPNCYDSTRVDSKKGNKIQFVDQKQSNKNTNQMTYEVVRGITDTEKGSDELHFKMTENTSDKHVKEKLCDETKFHKQKYNCEQKNLMKTMENRRRVLNEKNQYKNMKTCPHEMQKCQNILITKALRHEEQQAHINHVDIDNQHTCDCNISDKQISDDSVFINHIYNQERTTPYSDITNLLTIDQIIENMIEHGAETLTNRDKHHSNQDDKIESSSDLLPVKHQHIITNIKDVPQVNSSVRSFGNLDEEALLGFLDGFSGESYEGPLYKSQIDLNDVEQNNLHRVSQYEPIVEIKEKPAIPPSLEDQMRAQNGHLYGTELKSRETQEKPTVLVINNDSLENSDVKHKQEFSDKEEEDFDKYLSMFMISESNLKENKDVLALTEEDQQVCKCDKPCIQAMALNKEKIRSIKKITKLNTRKNAGYHNIQVRTSSKVYFKNSGEEVEQAVTLDTNEVLYGKGKIKFVPWSDDFGQHMKESLISSKIDENIDFSSKIPIEEINILEKQKNMNFGNIFESTSIFEQNSSEEQTISSKIAISDTIANKNKNILREKPNYTKTGKNKKIYTSDPSKKKIVTIKRYVEVDSDVGFFYTLK